MIFASLLLRALLDDLRLLLLRVLTSLPLRDFSRYYILAFSPLWKKQMPHCDTLRSAASCCVCMLSFGSIHLRGVSEFSPMRTLK